MRKNEARLGGGEDEIVAGFATFPGIFEDLRYRANSSELMVRRLRWFPRMRLQLFKKRKSAPARARHPSPELRVDSVSDLLQEARQSVMPHGDVDVVLDLSNVVQISSDELSEIIRLHLACREKDKRLVVANPQGIVAETLEITRLGRTVKIRNHPSIGGASPQAADDFQFAKRFLGRYPAKQHA